MEKLIKFEKTWDAIADALWEHYQGRTEAEKFEADQIKYRAELKKALKEKTMREHHFSWASGYVSRKMPEGIVVPYKGRYGEGFKVFTPSWQSSSYCTVTYYVLEKYFN